MSTEIILLALCVSAVIVVILEGVRRHAARVRDQQRTYELNAGLSDTMLSAFDKILTYRNAMGMELRWESVMSLKNGEYEIEETSLPLMLPDEFGFLLHAESRIQILLFQGTKGTPIIIWKYPVSARAMKFGSNFISDPMEINDFPYSNYPVSKRSLVGIVHEMISLMKRLEMDALPYPPNPHQSP